MSGLWRDFVFAVRLLIHQPGFAVVAVVTLALGIGANTAVFSVIHGVLWNAVPFEEPERLVFMGEHSEQVPNMSVSYPNFLDWEERNESFEAIAAHNYTSFNLTGLEIPEVLAAARVSQSIFSILRVEPMLGRVFLEEEDKVGGEQVTIVSYDFWQSRLGGNPDVTSQTLTLDGQPYQIVGVMPRGFLYPISFFQPDVWMPIEPFAERWLERRGSHPGIYVTGRLAPGVTMDEAEAEMQAIAAALAEEYPSTNTGNSISFAPLVDRLVQNIRPMVLVLSAAMALVLLIACVNVANLLLARGLARRREMAVRTALGSGKWQLARQLLTESVVVSVVAGIVGVAVAYGGLALLKAGLDPQLVRLMTLEINTPVLFFTLLLSVATGVVFGFFPALQLLRVNITGGLKDGGRGASVAQGWLRSALVSLQVALALVVLLCALLFIQSFRELNDANPGFDDRNVLAMSVGLPNGRYETPEAQAQFFQELLREVRSLPGVESAATSMPLLGGWQDVILAEGMPPQPAGEEISADIHRVSADFFETMGIQVLRGRPIEETDRADSVPVAVIDTTLAERFWPGEDPLGKRDKMSNDPGADEPWWEVVGVVNHTKNYGVAQPSRIEIYLPVLQDVGSTQNLILKTSVEPRTLVEPVRNAVLSIDAEQPVSRVRTVAEMTAAITSPQRMAVGFLGVFSGVALALAAIGIYGVMAYNVAQERHEIGIRIALGASSSNVLSRVVRRGMTLASVGIAVGIVLAVVLTIVLSSFLSDVLFGIEARDPTTFVVLTVLLGAVALVACAVPALRASRVSPTTVLRYE